MNSTAVHTHPALLCPCRAKIPQSSGGQYSERLWKQGCHDSCERPNRGTNQIRQLCAVSALLTATFRAQCILILLLYLYRVVFQAQVYAHSFI